MSRNWRRRFNGVFLFARGKQETTPTTPPTDACLLQQRGRLDCKVVDALQTKTQLKHSGGAGCVGRVGLRQVNIISVYVLYMSLTRRDRDSHPNKRRLHIPHLIILFVFAPGAVWSPPTWFHLAIHYRLLIRIALDSHARRLPFDNDDARMNRSKRILRMQMNLQQPQYSHAAPPPALNIIITSPIVIIASFSICFYWNASATWAVKGHRFSIGLSAYTLCKWGVIRGRLLVCKWGAKHLLITALGLAWQKNSLDVPTLHFLNLETTFQIPTNVNWI